jgi:adenylate cyclase
VVDPGRLDRLLDALARLGALPSDPEEVRVRKATLTLLTLLIVPLATIWVVTYGVLGLWASASIPFAYQVLSLASLVWFARTRRYELFRSSQLFLMLLLPFALQWTLGGFRASSAVSIWAFASPLAALAFVGPRKALPWFAGYGALLVASTVLEFTVSGEAHIPEGVQVVFFFLNIAGLSVVTFLTLNYFVRERERAMVALDREHQLLQVERAKAERLLLNVLPRSIADRLKEREEVIADAFPDVTVMFADIVGFTPYAIRTTPDRTVETLNDLFSEFDDLAERRGLEKIKTIGDAYMVAGGLPEPAPGHAEAVADMALEMMDVARTRILSDGEPVSLRIGIDSGPVVAGVIGRRKFIYDLWGDTVNTASRMESQGVPGCIQVTERTRAILGDRYAFTERGEIEVKGKGAMITFFLTGREGGSG